MLYHLDHYHGDRKKRASKVKSVGKSVGKSIGEMGADDMENRAMKKQSTETIEVTCPYKVLSPCAIQ